MKYFKYYVVGYYGETLGSVCGYDKLSDAEDLVRWQKRHAAYTAIEICLITDFKREVIERTDRRK